MGAFLPAGVSSTQRRPQVSAWAAWFSARPCKQLANGWAARQPINSTPLQALMHRRQLRKASAFGVYAPDVTQGCFISPLRAPASMPSLACCALRCQRHRRRAAIEPYNAWRPKRENLL